MEEWKGIERGMALNAGGILGAAREEGANGTDRLGDGLGVGVGVGAGRQA
jgi:hypothetical protein